MCPILRQCQKILKNSIVFTQSQKSLRTTRPLFRSPYFFRLNICVDRIFALLVFVYSFITIPPPSPHHVASMLRLCLLESTRAAAPAHRSHRSAVSQLLTCYRPALRYGLLTQQKQTLRFVQQLSTYRVLFHY